MARAQNRKAEAGAWAWGMEHRIAEQEQGIEVKMEQLKIE